MDDDKQTALEHDKADILPGGGNRRPPPTIELTASSIAKETNAPAPEAGATDEPPAEGSAHEDQRESNNPEIDEEVKELAAAGSPASILSTFILPAVTGAVAALVVLVAAHQSGWFDAPVVTSPPATSSAEMDALGARLAKVESDVAKPAAQVTDTALAARVDALEKSIASLRDDVASVRGQGEKAVAALADLKSSPAPQSAPAVDTSAIDARLDKLEQAATSLNAAVARPVPPAEDPKLRRMTVASLLETSLRQGEPYEPLLAAARDAGGRDDLKPLDAFASSGLPSAAALCRELLALLPQLASQETATSASSGIIERLQQSAMKLVRIQRTDAPVDSSNAIVNRVAVAAQRNDLAEARRDVSQLSDHDKALLQPWIAKVDGREAALAAAHQFAMDAVAVLPKPVR